MGRCYAYVHLRARRQSPDDLGCVRGGCQPVTRILHVLTILPDSSTMRCVTSMTQSAHPVGVHRINLGICTAVLASSTARIYAESACDAPEGQRIRRTLRVQARPEQRLGPNPNTSSQSHTADRAAGPEHGDPSITPCKLGQAQARVALSVWTPGPSSLPAVDHTAHVLWLLTCDAQ